MAINRDSRHTKAKPYIFACPNNPLHTFGHGALHGAQWLAKRSLGYIGMQDVLGL